MGTFPEAHSADYCWGGCPGSLQEAMHVFRAFYPNVEKEMEKILYVVGRVEGPLDLKEGEKVIFAGGCTGWKGTIDGKDVTIESSYKTTREVDEKKTKSNDMLLKTTKTLLSCMRNRNSRYLHVKGCPISVADHVHYLSAAAKIKNVNFDHRYLIPVNIAYWQMRANRFLNRFFG
ncbi:MAG: hypothetical protein Q8N95_06670 [Desulfobacterales bacterium]|nr:hypothetical protein [Desulfobacterales bacterium]